MKRALITGITGQDGAYLAKLLLNKNYEVYGLQPRRTGQALQRLDDLKVRDSVKLLDGDLTDQSSLIHAMEVSQADEVYNLGAQSFVGTSWTQPLLTTEVTGVGTLRMLEAVRLVNAKAKFYQASTSEMYGAIKEPLQSEGTPFHPRSPYGVAKLFAHWATINYRESYGMFACCGILFNHESPLRGREFVTRRISDAVARIKLGKQEKLHLGNLEARRDWGFAGDYVRGIWMILQQEEPNEFVLATGQTRTVRDFCKEAFGCAGLDYAQYVESDPERYRPAEVDVLQGNPNKANTKLGWTPEVSFEELVQIMVEADLERVKAE